jgi:serine/threonine protein kinase
MTLRHQHIVQCFGLRRTADTMYLFLEFMPGGTLSTLIKAVSLAMHGFSARASTHARERCTGWPVG